MTPLVKIEVLGVPAIAASMFAMSDANTGSLIQTVGVILTTLIAAVAAFYARRAEKKAQEAKDNSQEAKETAEMTHKSVDGRVSEFLEMAKNKFHAEGVAQEQTDERGRKAATDAGVLKEKEAEQKRQDNQIKP